MNRECRIQVSQGNGLVQEVFFGFIVAVMAEDIPSAQGEGFYPILQRSVTCTLAFDPYQHISNQNGFA
jgi:hypothetical protein